MRKLLSQTSLRSILNLASESFQVLSDLHLEVGQQYSSFTIPPIAANLILAGDVGRLTDYDGYLGFIKSQTDQFKRVFLVLGNHEFYGISFRDGLQKAKKLEAETCLNGRLILLQNSRLDIPGSSVTVVGCTLWSRIPADAEDIVRSKIKDFQRIDSWTVEAHNAAHNTDICWLMDEIKSIRQQTQNTKKPRTILVVTHHAPSIAGTSSPQHTLNPWNSAFATDVLHEDGWDGVKVWAFGHTHFTTEFKVDGIKVLSNQRGYVFPWSKQQTKADFDARKVIWI